MWLSPQNILRLETVHNQLEQGQYDWIYFWSSEYPEYNRYPKEYICFQGDNSSLYCLLIFMRMDTFSYGVDKLYYWNFWTHLGCLITQQRSCTMHLSHSFLDLVSIYSSHICYILTSSLIWQTSSFLRKHLHQSMYRPCLYCKLLLFYRFFFESFSPYLRSALFCS